MIARLRRALGALTLLGALAGAGAAAVAHLDLAPRPALPGASAGSAAADSVVTARAQLDALRVEPMRSVPGYSRDQFGQRWADIDRNGCDQRNDALRAGASSVTTKPGTHDCVVLTATIHDPYSGAEIAFVKGESTVDIDHVVPLNRAWDQGAAQWTPERRETFANTPSELVAVDSSANRSKGDRGPEEWLPADGCGYAQRWIGVKAEFDLSVTAQEKSALEGALVTCGGVQ